jgi:hypothetical protein
VTSIYRLQAVAGCWLILLLAGSGSAGAAGTGPAASSVPVLTWISPSNQSVGAGAFSLRANGSNFSSDSVVQWNGSALATTFVGATELTAQVPANDVITAGTVEIKVFTPGAGGGTSGAVPLKLTNLVPRLTAISPVSATVGSAALTLTATGTAFGSDAQINWNGTALKTTYVSSTQLTAQVPASDLATVRSAQVGVFNPTPGGGQSGYVTFYIESGATRLAVVSVDANDILWDAANARIYASLPKANNANGNSVVSINPVTGIMDTVRAASKGPNLLSLSSDSGYLWVGEDGGNAVQRFSLPSLKLDFTIPIAPLSLYGPMTAIALEAAPDSPHTAAILLGSTDWEPADIGGAYVYDDAIPRPTGIDPFQDTTTDLEWLQWGANASALYGGNSDIPSGFYTMGVSSAGIEAQAFYGDELNGSGHFDETTGYVYGDNGQVMNPVTGEAVGAFFQNEITEPVTCVVDSAQGVVFFLSELLNEGGAYGIQAFDQKTFRLLRTLLLPQVEGVPVKLIRWGKAGLAINSVPLSYQTAVPFPGAIYLVDGSFVNSAETPDFSTGAGVQPQPTLTSMNPQSTTTGSGSITLTIEGSNFDPGAIVNFGTQTISAEYISHTELQAKIPASDLAAAGVQFVTVSNGTPATQTLNDLAFYVIPANSGLITVNLASLDVAWDEKSALLYAAVWSEDTQYPDSIVAINPTSGSVVKSQFAGADPDLVRTTSDGAYVYSATLNSDTVSQFPLPSLGPPLTWRLGVDTSSASYVPLASFVAVDVQPAPGASQTTAVVTSYDGTNSDSGITIFDNNVARSVQALDTFANGAEYGSAHWGLNAGTLYAEIPDLYPLKVNSKGVTQVGDHYELNQSPMHFDPGTGYLYFDDGSVINPATWEQVGVYGSSGMAIPDSSLNLVFFLGQTVAQRGSTDYTVTSYNQKTFAPVSSITIPSLVDFPVAFIRWGVSGLALVTYDYYSDLAASPPGVLYILNDRSFVTADQPAASRTHPPEQVQRTWKKPRLPIRPAARGMNRQEAMDDQARRPD